MIIKSKDAQIESPKDPLTPEQRGGANLTLIVNTVEDLRRKNPPLYAELRTKDWFRRLPNAQEPERSQLFEQFLSEVKNREPGLFQVVRGFFRGKNSAPSGN